MSCVKPGSPQQTFRDVIRLVSSVASALVSLHHGDPDKEPEWVFCFLNYFIECVWLFCMDICLCTCVQCSWVTGKGIRSPGAGANGGFWKLNLGPLEEQPMLNHWAIALEFFLAQNEMCKVQMW